MDQEDIPVLLAVALSPLGTLPIHCTSSSLSPLYTTHTPRIHHAIELSPGPTILERTQDFLARAPPKQAPTFPAVPNSASGHGLSEEE